MIISHRHGFIFVKTMKTAGSSVELYLRQFCGPDDVVTWLGREDEALAERLGVGGARNETTRRMWPWEFRTRSLARARRRRWYPRHEVFRGHSSSAHIRSVVGANVWSRYRTISIVRNPWDAAVSRGFWRAKFRRIDLATALHDAVERAGANWSLYTIDDEVAVDTVLRYEHLQADLERLTAELGLVPRIGLPGAKVGVRPTGTPAHEVLSLDQARRVAELARREIETFGYTWSGPDPL